MTQSRTGTRSKSRGGAVGPGLVPGRRGVGLFTPRAAYRFRVITAPSSTYDDPTTGEDPRYGAYLNYWLKAPAAEAPRVTIRDAAGKVVRTLTGTNQAGSGSTG